MQILLLKVHIHTDFPESSCNGDAVKGVSGKPADGLNDNHVNFAFPAETKHLVKLIPFFHARPCDALVGKNTD